jgi:hypothetical protein
MTFLLIMACPPSLDLSLMMPTHHPVKLQCALQNSNVFLWGYYIRFKHLISDCRQPDAASPDWNIRRHRNIIAICNYLLSKTYALLKHHREHKHYRGVITKQGGTDVKSRCFEQLILINNDVLKYCEGMS